MAQLETTLGLIWHYELKYLRLVSDIHLDFDVRLSKTKELPAWQPDEMPDDHDTVLVIAGDLWLERRFIDRKYPDGTSWLERVALRFKYVVFVLGNHDYWDMNLLYEADKVKAAIKENQLRNVFLLERDTVILDQVKFVGGTLWTDYNRCCPLITGLARSLTKDLQFIRYGRDYRSTNPAMIYEVFMKTKKYIFENAKRDNPDQIVAVVTHMAPSYQSIHPRFRTYRDAETNFLYHSSLEDRIAVDGKEIDLWMHGHVHATADYMLHPNVWVLCNPRGYVGEFGVGYDPTFRIDLENFRDREITLK